MLFSDRTERDITFLNIEGRLVDKSKKSLKGIQKKCPKPQLIELENRITDLLSSNGFIQVFTPIIISRGSLEKMAIDSTHPLSKQVFWLNEKKCLRPMLAPNLYFLLRELVRVWEKPVRIFESGPCFRKDSAGKYHANEFTMLNLVELGPAGKNNRQRMEALAVQVLEVAGIQDYRFSVKRSEVYGKTIDILAAGVEIASGAIGPHVLDSRWGIHDPWIGIGFGLERIVMIKEKYQNIQKAGRALVYLDGIRLNL